MKIKRVKKLIHKYLRWWIPQTGLGFWNISVTFEDVPEDKPAGVAATANIQWQYLQARIAFYPEQLIDASPHNIEHLVVHELVHVLTNEMLESGIKHEERAVTIIENAFMWVKGAKI